MADKKISQLDLAAQINNDAVIPMSQENGGEQTTYKALITALGAKIAEGLTFSNLATTAKNLVGAINELQAGGGGGGAAILIGTTTPSSSQGSNGNLYIKYTEGVGGADDTVDAIYVKLDGTWCEVTTDYADLLNKPSINNNTLSGNKTNNDLGIYGKTIEMSSTDPDKVADRIKALEYSSGDQMGFAFQQLLCRIDSNGKRLSIFIPLSKIVKASSVTASGSYSVYDINANSLLSNHDITNDTQGITIVNNGVVLTITLTTALSVTLGYGVIELRNTFKLTFA